jgi:Protein of unknown function (DUF2806)
MATGWEMVPETAKALSAPLTKLIEVVATGCGRVYGPTDVKRTAAAQGEAMVLLEEAKARASEVALRAANRILDVEIRRQQNIDAITQIAQEQLPDAVSDIPVDADWAGRFFREAQDVSNLQMRLLWGKLLSGEVVNPGSFSHRTLAVVSNLGQSEADKFEALCSMAVKIMGKGPLVIVGVGGASIGKQPDLLFEDFVELQAAGLITHEPQGTQLQFHGVEGQGHALFIERPAAIAFVAKHSSASATLPLGVVGFTSAGGELFSIAEWRAVPEHDKVIYDLLVGAGWSVERRRIVLRQDDGRLIHVPFPFPDQPQN